MNKKYYTIFIRLCFAISIPLATIIHASLNRERPVVHVVKTFVDNMIPFNKYFAVPYLFMFAYITISLLFFAVKDGKSYFSLLASDVTGMFICFILFYSFQTEVERPVVYGNDFFSGLVKYIYNTDNPYNCFPSIHVLSSYLPFLFAFKYNKSTIMKVFTTIGFVLISVSTFFIKQHYVLDAVAAILLGTILFYVFTSKIWGRLPYVNSLEFLVIQKKPQDVESR
jgi:hypothetical protein